MATVFWTGNSIATPQVDTLTVTAVAAGGTLTATINGKPITYTCTGSDTTTTAATAWLALLQSQTAPPEFGEVTWANPSAGVITGTGPDDGTPIGLTSSDGGGATRTQSTTAPASPSDVSLNANWLRGGSPGIPQNGDDVIVADTSIPLLWNLASLAAVQFASYTRHQSQTAPIGLPEYNANGYYEYRQKYFKFSGSGTLSVVLGFGQTGGGPPRERYDVGAQRTDFTILASGSPIDDYAIYLLGTNANNTISVVGTTVAVATLPAEVSTIASATVDTGQLSLGAGVTFSGALVVTGGVVVTSCAPASITARNGSSVVVEGTGLTFAAVTANASTVTWLSGSTITTLTLQAGSIFNKGLDLRPMTITNSAIDGDTCLVIDTYSKITWTNATTVNNQTTTGPFAFGPGRTVKIT